jgi:hypothetical protein
MRLSTHTNLKRTNISRDELPGQTCVLRRRRDIRRRAGPCEASLDAFRAPAFISRIPRVVHTALSDNLNPPSHDVWEGFVRSQRCGDDIFSVSHESDDFPCARALSNILDGHPVALIFAQLTN